MYTVTLFGFSKHQLVFTTLCKIGAAKTYLQTVTKLCPGTYLKIIVTTLHDFCWFYYCLTFFFKRMFILCRKFIIEGF